MKRLIIGLSLLICITASAQDARSLVKEGIQLSSTKDYTGAIEKFRSALAVEPDNASANYQMGFTLNASGKGADALPYLQKATVTNSAVAGAAYALMGSVYDRANQSQKAVESFLSAIKITPNDYSLHYGIGLAYFRARRYADAEQSALNALKLEPKHPGSIRLYALVTFHQNKRAPALLALCQFLWLEPNGTKSAEAYGNMQSILSGGELKAEPGIKPVNATNRYLNNVIITSAQLATKAKYATAADKLSAQLQYILENIGPIAEKQTGNDSLFTALTRYYYKLSQTGRLPAYARFISQGADKSAATWVSAHPQEIEGLKEWIKNNI
ncbi:MAG: tetratricopeptide repeat protein [Mucilaginibacter sp.]